MQECVGGVDGCPGGWVLVTAPTSGSGCRVEVMADFASIVARLDDRRLAAVAVDMPIGLPPHGPRQCDIDARKLIGARRSSVFPAPARGLLGATTYAETLTISGERALPKISRQTFGILPKIREVDRLISPGRQAEVVECHPEVSFTVVAGAPMVYPKRTPEGRAERLAALRSVFCDADDIVDDRVPGTRPDDVVDALVVAWSALRWRARRHLQLGGMHDERGLRMEIVA